MTSSLHELGGDLRAGPYVATLAAIFMAGLGRRGRRMGVRDAIESSIEEIASIYNEVPNHCTAIYSDRPATDILT